MTQALRVRRDCERTTGGRSGSIDQPTAEQALRQLEPRVGEWTFEAKWPDGEPWPSGGRVTFEWHASGAHLLERGTSELPEAVIYAVHHRLGNLGKRPFSAAAAPIAGSRPVWVPAPRPQG